MILVSFHFARLVRFQGGMLPQRCLARCTTICSFPDILVTTFRCQPLPPLSLSQSSSVHCHRPSLSHFWPLGGILFHRCCTSVLPTPPAISPRGWHRVRKRVPFLDIQLVSRSEHMSSIFPLMADRHVHPNTYRWPLFSSSLMDPDPTMVDIQDIIVVYSPSKS